jgi:group I intron endonuclease
VYAIYIITNILNGMQYIGITNDLSRRWARHRGANEDQFIHRAIKKHGVNNFVFTHFADAFTVESAKILERMLIAEHNTLAPCGYNLTAGGDGTFGRKHSEETKAKIRQTNKKTWADPSLRKTTAESISKAKMGKPTGRKGIPNGLKGIPHSEEHTAKIKAALKAYWAIRKAKQSTEKETT